MTTYEITNPFEIFTDLDGDPLENGYIWIGEEGKNPLVYPIKCYWDSSFSYPVSQPIRTDDANGGTSISTPLETCNKGVHELYGVVRNFLYNVTSTAEGTQITNCVYGMFAKELCTGHGDYMTFDGNAYSNDR